jgi:hypothetical protein
MQAFVGLSVALTVLCAGDAAQQRGEEVDKPDGQNSRFMRCTDCDTQAAVPNTAKSPAESRFVDCVTFLFHAFWPGSGQQKMSVLPVQQNCKLHAARCKLSAGLVGPEYLGRT